MELRNEKASENGKPVKKKLDGSSENPHPQNLIAVFHFHLPLLSKNNEISKQQRKEAGRLHEIPIPLKSESEYFNSPRIIIYFSASSFSLMLTSFFMRGFLISIHQVSKLMRFNSEDKIYSSSSKPKPSK